jgi:hypothetical protein
MVPRILKFPPPLLLDDVPNLDSKDLYSRLKAFFIFWSKKSYLLVILLRCKIFLTKKKKKKRIENQ